MFITHRLRNPRLWCVAALILGLGATGGNAFADPPDRVARISFLSGNVSFQPAGDDQWAQASLNRPLVTGDQVYTDRNSRVELEVGGATLRLDQDSAFNLLNLDDNTAQIELTGGVVNLDVRGLASGQVYEVDTPTLAFVVSQPGNYRIDIAPDGTSSMVTVFEGAGDVYGENNASYSVRGGNTYRFNDTSLRDYEILDLPRPDAFDQWCRDRGTRYQRSVSRTYVPDNMIGAADLDAYGSWNQEADYGNVWYPTTVAADWAPYRSGHWSWIDPWGWTWVDNAPWGFAPFHYGRWAYIGNRWGWCPGPRVGLAVYAPAMVAFVGGGGWGTSISVGIGGGGPVGWFPLGPRDVYVPWYHASRGYFTNINVRNTTIINNTYITNVYNDYSRGRPITNMRYAYRGNAAAVTAVPRDAFIGSRSVLNSRVRVDPARLRDAQVVSRVAIAPQRASFVSPGAVRGRGAPPAAVMDRRVIARSAPPPRPAPIATRLQAIERNQGQPLQGSQLRELAKTRPAAGAAERAPSRIQVVGREGAARPEPLPARGAVANRAGPANPRNAPPGVPAAQGRGREAPAAPNAGRERANATMPRGTETQPAERSALPSSRFAPHAGEARGNAATRGNAASPPGRTPSERAEQMPPGRNQPAERFAPRGNAQPPNVSERQPATQPREQARPAPQVREMPRNEMPRNEPAPRYQDRVQPRVERSAPPPQAERSMERQAPPRMERNIERQPPPRAERTIERQAPPPRMERQAPPPRMERQAPPPQMERQAPRAEQRQAPPRGERPAPQERRKKDDNGGHF